MSAIQTTDRIVFGVGSLFEIQPGGYPVRIANATDIAADFKAELKEAWAEPGFPIAVADGHRSIDITAKHYTLTPQLLANALNGSVATGTTSAMVVDEAGTVDASAHTYQLAQHATYVASTAVVVGFPISGGIAVPTHYAIVAPSSEAAGVSCSITAGTLTFATGDASIAIQVSYEYGVTAGSRVTVTNQPQNTSKVQQLIAVKRDTSTLDNSTSQIVSTFFAVRTAGIKNEYKEGDFTVFERMYKAFADAQSRIVQVDFVNV